MELVNVKYKYSSTADGDFNGNGVHDARVIRGHYRCDFLALAAVFSENVKNLVNLFVLNAHKQSKVARAEKTSRC